MNVTLLSLKQQRHKIIELARQYGVNNLRIFGSVARNEAKETSDIDFLVDMDVDRGLLAKIAFMQDLEKLLNKKIDVVTEKSLHWYIREQILKEAIPL